MAQKGVGSNSKFDWSALETEFLTQDKYTEIKPWWELEKKQAYHAYISRKTKGWTKKRDAMMLKAKEEAQKKAIQTTAKNLQIDIAEAIKLEKRLFIALQMKLDTEQKIRDLSLKELESLQNILYKFMGKPTLITQNNYDVAVKSVHMILHSLQNTGALKNPFYNDDGTPKYEPGEQSGAN